MRNVICHQNSYKTYMLQAQFNWNEMLVFEMRKTTPVSLSKHNGTKLFLKSHLIFVFKFTKYFLIFNLYKDRIEE